MASTDRWCIDCGGDVIHSFNGYFCVQCQDAWRHLVGPSKKEELMHESRLDFRDGVTVREN